MVDACCYYGIYPEEIQRAQDIVNEIIYRYNLSYDINEEIDTAFYECGSLEDITNSLILAMFSTVKSKLDNMGIENDYYINGYDTHFYINGEEI